MSDPQPPIALPNIDLKSVIGTGKFGRVWQAQQQDANRTVAVKIGHTQLTTKADKTRFENECATLHRLAKEPGFLDLYSSGIADNGYPYIVTEYAERGTLKQAHKDLTESQLIDIGIELCDSIMSAHDNKILHQDLRPATVFLRTFGQPAIGDFGITKLHGKPKTSTQNLATTVAFTAPEILKGKPASTTTDVYGIAVTLAATTLGRSPFVSENGSETPAIVRHVLTEPPIDLASTSLSQEFLTVLIAGMAKNPTDRPTSAVELKARLEHLKNETNQTMEQTEPDNSPKDCTERLPKLPIINDSTMGTVVTSQTSSLNKPAIATAILLAAVFILAVTVIAVRSTEIDEEAIRADTVLDTDPTDPTTSENNTQAAPPTITRSHANTEEDNIPQASITAPSETAASRSLLPQPDVIAPSGTFVEPNFKTIDVLLTHEVTSINYHGRLQGNETHDYMFEATQGQQLDVMFTGETNTTNVRYTLIHPNGTELFTDRAEPYSHILPTGGTFQLSVEPSQGLEGEYNVQISLRQPSSI